MVKLSNHLFTGLGFATGFSHYFLAPTMLGIMPPHAGETYIASIRIKPNMVACGARR